MLNNPEAVQDSMTPSNGYFLKLAIVFEQPSYYTEVVQDSMTRQLAKYSMTPRDYHVYELANEINTN
jgi:hypothetical protein